MGYDPVTGEWKEESKIKEYEKIFSMPLIPSFLRDSNLLKNVEVLVPLFPPVYPLNRIFGALRANSSRFK